MEKETLKILNDKKNLYYNDLLNIFEIVKNFIIKHKLILYGGQSIDFALRLKQTYLYKDKLPDYDFFTYDLHHAYELSKLLAQTYDDINIFNAKHLNTIRVSYKKLLVADISYMPLTIFNQIPTLDYPTNKNFIKIVHPLYQKADLYKSLSSPFINPPFEPIFYRFDKDIERLNLLNKYYPDKLKKNHNTKKQTLSFDIENFKSSHPNGILTGVLAYCFYITVFKKLNPNSSNYTDFIDVSFSKKDSVIEFELYAKNTILEIIEDTNNINHTNAKYYTPFMDDLIPRSIVTSDSIIYHNTGKSYVNMFKIKIDSIHSLILHFLIRYIKNPENTLYFNYYVSLTNLVSTNYPFNISLNTYQVKNKIILNEMAQLQDKNIRPEIKISLNKTEEIPNFNVSDFLYFKMNQEQIKNFDTYLEIEKLAD